MLCSICFLLCSLDFRFAHPGGGGGGKEYTYLAGSGKSLSEARRAVDMQMDKLLFLGTVRALVITERAAADDLGDICFGCEKIRSIDRR